MTERTNKTEKLYSGAIEALLGVREMTRTDTVLFETGMTAAKDLIRKKTETFVRKKTGRCRARDALGYIFYKKAV